MTPPSPPIRGKRHAAELFGWLADLPEVAHLEPEARDAVAVGATLAAMRGRAFRAQHRLESAFGIFWLPVVFIVPFFALGCGLGIRAGHGLALAVFFAYALLSMCLRRRIRQHAMRWWSETAAKGSVTTRESPPPPELTAMAQELRHEVALARATTWHRLRAMAWATRLRLAPEVSGVEPLAMQALAIEAADKAVADPLVRTLWKLALLSMALVALAPLLEISLALKEPLMWSGTILPHLLLGVIVPAGLYVTAGLRGRRLARSHLRLALLLSGIRPARCFVCRQDLRDVARSACPRCGTRLLREP